MLVEKGGGVRFSCVCRGLSIEEVFSLYAVGLLSLLLFVFSKLLIQEVNSNDLLFTGKYEYGI